MKQRKAESIVSSIHCLSAAPAELVDLVRQIKAQSFLLASKPNDEGVRNQSDGLRAKLYRLPLVLRNGTSISFRTLSDRLMEEVDKATLQSITPENFYSVGVFKALGDIPIQGTEESKGRPSKLRFRDVFIPYNIQAESGRIAQVSRKHDLILAAPAANMDSGLADSPSDNFDMTWHKDIDEYWFYENHWA